MLKPWYKNKNALEAGIDEAGRGCLAGPVFAAAVILGQNIPSELSSRLNDSKKISAHQRSVLRVLIEEHCLAWAVGIATNEEIDRINILNASFLAMHRALEQLKVQPELLLIDGNRFRNNSGIPHICIIKGDGLYLSVAAASILAKTWRDVFMMNSHNEYPQYGWLKNKGYPTSEHRQSIAKHGLSPLHRKSFNSGLQMKLSLD